MTRRAFTLVEVLLSLMLLGSLTVATVAWTTKVLVIQQEQQQSQPAMEAAGRIERSIRIDLANEDTRLQSLSGREHRVWVDRATLFILTRDGGPVEISYRLDGQGVLIRSVRSLTSGGDTRSEPITGGVNAIVWSMDAPEGRPYAVLRAVWRGGAGEPQQLRIEVPQGWVP